MEPDHSSSLAAVMGAYPDIQIVGNKKTRMMIKNFYAITENFIEIEDGDTLDLGGRVLQFFNTPMVHWPESMVTYEKGTGTLFSMDIFGSYKAPVGSIFADENNLEEYLPVTYRYYASTVGKVTEMAQKALKKLSPLSIKMVCPAHALIWRTPEDIDYLMDLWTRLAYQKTEPGVVIVYGTMYGNSLEIAQIIADQLRAEGVEKIILHDVGNTNISYILSDLWRYQGAVFGCPAYYGGIFPPMQALLYKLAGNKLRNNICGFFTEYSWSGGAESVFEDFITKAGAHTVGDIIRVQGAADDNDKKALLEMAGRIAKEVVKAHNETDAGLLVEDDD